MLWFSAASTAGAFGQVSTGFGGVSAFGAQAPRTGTRHTPFVASEVRMKPAGNFDKTLLFAWGHEIVHE